MLSMIVASSVTSATTVIGDWFQNNKNALIMVPLRILLIVTLAVVMRYAAKRLIRHAVRHLRQAPLPAPAGGDHRVADKDSRITRERRRQRADTVSMILGCSSTVAITAAAVMLVLGDLGVNLAPLIASAGIIGIAVGFGAQSLVGDFLSGMFMLLEDQYGVGDAVQLDGITSGLVERVGLRVTQLRNPETGCLWFVRNGDIRRLGNHTQDWAIALLDIAVAYDEDIDQATKILDAAARSLAADRTYCHHVLGEPESWGIQALTADSVTLRVSIKTAPHQQWPITRELRRRIKTAFDDHGIRTSPTPPA